MRIFVNRWMSGLALMVFAVGCFQKPESSPESQAGKPDESKGLILPAECRVFAPFVKEDGVPSVEFLKNIPGTLELGGNKAVGRVAHFDPSSRELDLAPFLGGKDEKLLGRCAFVYIPFEVEVGGEVTLGFGADWWYAAYLDGDLISDTISGGKGNGDSPPSARNHKTNVKLSAGKHMLAVRFISGSGSSVLAVGGAGDLLKLKGSKNGPCEISGFKPGPPLEYKWKLVWSDEFNGSSLDLKKWEEVAANPLKCPGMSTKFNKANCAVDGNGTYAMRLTQEENGTVEFGGPICTRESRSFGYYETRVQFSAQPGWWTSVCIINNEPGDDTFRYPQEFDLYEDFTKPKTNNDIQMSYWVNSSIGVGTEDQPATKHGPMIDETKISRMLSFRKVRFDRYDGWHTIGLLWTPLEVIYYADGQETHRMSYKDMPMTTVPNRICIVPCYGRGPSSPTDKPFYGRLDEAKLPDQALVDYVRFYEIDNGTKTAPVVELRQTAPLEALRPGVSLKLEVSVKDLDGKVKKLMLFANGRLRQEVELDSSSARQTFILTNLFDGENTIMAMAKDNDGLVGLSMPLIPTLALEHNGTPFNGTPQKIPGKVRAGYYDAGGRGAAFRGTAKSNDTTLPWRIDEIPRSTEDAIPVGFLSLYSVTYTVNVQSAGDYDVELFMNRPNFRFHWMEGLGNVELLIADKLIAKWSVSENWNSGLGWRAPSVGVGVKRIHLDAGEQKLLIRFDSIKRGYTYFCGLNFKLAN